MKICLFTSVAAVALIIAAPALAQTPQGQTKEAPSSAPPKADTPAAPSSKEAPRPAPKASGPAQEKAGPTAQDKNETTPAKQRAEDKATQEKEPARKTDSSRDKKQGAAEKETESKPSKADKGSSKSAAAPPAEKRTQIVSTIKETRVSEVTNVNFNISIGAKVPRTVKYHPLPPRVVEIYPEWRGYYFILVKGRYLVLEPETYEIVYIIEG